MPADPRSVFARPLRAGQLLALDCLAAAGYLGVAGLATVAHPVAGGPPLWLRVGLLVMVGLPLAVRRRWPVPVCCVVLAGSVLGLVLGATRDPLVAAAFALYPVALVHRPRLRLPVLAIGVASAVVVLAGVLGGPVNWANGEVALVVVGCGMVGGAWTVGQAVGERRRYAARCAEQLAEQAVQDERLRIARELHDVVAHSMGVITVKAGVANHVLRERPDEAHEALRAIETAGRDALTEMRALLRVLRPDGETEPPLLPQPGLAGLPGLAERARRAGVEVDLAVHAPTAPPEGVELAVFRIVQEALTNVLKHAGPTRCVVRVWITGQQARLTVSDDGPATPRPGPPTAGHGIIGMRERALLYGGSLTAGPRPQGGYAVSARLPIQQARP